MRYVSLSKLLAGLLLGLAMAFSGGASRAAEAVATGFVVKGDGTSTRITIDLSADIGYAARVLPEPYRVIIDMAGVDFNVPPGQGRKGRGLVKALRYGIIELGKSRIVIDTVGPVLIGGSHLVAAKGKQPAQIVIELLAISEDIFMAAYAKDNPGVVLPRKTATPETVASIAPVAVPKPVLKPAPKPAPQQSIAKPVRPDGKKVIVIDAGHGGIDPGAVSPSNTKEKDMVLAFAQSLQATINAEGKAVALLTRDKDVFMSLKDRVKFAREHNADLLIAIHADIVRGKTATGTTIYTLSDTASDAEAEALAQKENKADLTAGMNFGLENEDVTDILIELIQRESKNHAVAFSRAMLKDLASVTPMAGKPLRSAAFTVLKAPDIPSVLVELGFLSTKADEERLQSKAWREKTAKALSAAITTHFANEVASQ